MKSDQVLALIDAHVRRDETRFRSVALQLAAAETRLGHAIGRQIERKVGTQAAQLVPLPRGSKNDSTLVEFVPVEHSLADLVLSEAVWCEMTAIVEEVQAANLLAEHHLRPMNRILFEGPPGTGKTASAHALAGALGWPLLVASQGALISSYLGETAANLQKAFEYIEQQQAVVLFDEFDSFGRSRQGSEKSDVGEMNRVVNYLLQRIERHRGPSILVFATNLPDVLDEALERRFDLCVRFDLPNAWQQRELVQRQLGTEGMQQFLKEKRETLLAKGKGPSHAVIVRECIRQRKREILAGRRIKAERDDD